MFNDALTIGGSSGAGTAIFSFALDGTGGPDSTSGSGGGFGESTLGYYFGPGQCFAENPIFCPQSALPLNPAAMTIVDVTDTDFSQIVSVSIPFVFGQKFAIEGFLSSVVDLGCTGPSGFCDAYLASGGTDFYNAVLSQIQVLDSTGQMLPGFQVTSDSGTSYGSQGVIPEPGSVALTLSGVVVLWCFLRNRRAELPG